MQRTRGAGIRALAAADTLAVVGGHTRVYAHVADHAALFFFCAFVGNEGKLYKGHFVEETVEGA